MKKAIIIIGSIILGVLTAKLLFKKKSIADDFDEVEYVDSDPTVSTDENIDVPVE